MEQVKKEGIKREKKTTYKLLQEVFGKGNYTKYVYCKFICTIITLILVVLIFGHFSYFEKSDIFRICNFWSLGEFKRLD